MNPWPNGMMKIYGTRLLICKCKRVILITDGSLTRLTLTGPFQWSTLNCSLFLSEFLRYLYFLFHAQWIRLLGLRCSWHLQGATIPIGANVSVSLVILPSVIKISLLHLHIRSLVPINFTIPLGHGFIDGSNFLSVFPHEVLADFPPYGLQSLVTFILKIISVGHRTGLISL